MALHRCGHCGTRDMLTHGMDRFHCLNCDGDTDYEGNALPRPPVFLVESVQERIERTGFANGT